MFYDHKRYVIVYNGELYNYKEVQTELKEVSFQTSSDTEVILAAYAKWGAECLNHFNGMFAFAIYDTSKQSLFIARDRLGVKPLYYSQISDTILFSSEIRSLLASEMLKKKMDRKSLSDYLQFQTVHAPYTIVENVKVLMPGHSMLIENKKVEIKEWWKPQITIPDNLPSYAEICKEVRKLLRDSVERRLVSDVPFGAFLSGGIDSTAVVGLMSEVSKTPVSTFTITFDDSEFSEAVYAKTVAEKFKTNHHEIRLNPSDFLKELPAALDAMDHPGGDGPNTFVVSKATKQAGVTMALSGLGGDELFCGYDIFKRSAELEGKAWLNVVPKSFRSIAGNYIKNRSKNVAGEKKAAILNLKKINFENFYPISRQVLLDEQIAKISDHSLPKSDSLLKIAGKVVTDFPQKNYLLSRVSITEISGYMQNVLLRDSDQMSMAYALEVREPFLDYKLVEYVLNLPDEIKFPVTPKKLLVDALADIIPPEIVNRPKMGFTFPWKNWMKNELKEFCELRLVNLGKRESFNAEGLLELWNDFLKDDPRVSWSRIWPLVVLSHWLEKNGIE